MADLQASIGKKDARIRELEVRGQGLGRGKLLMLMSILMILFVSMLLMPLMLIPVLMVLMVLTSSCLSS